MIPSAKRLSSLTVAAAVAITCAAVVVLACAGCGHQRKAAAPPLSAPPATIRIDAPTANDFQALSNALAKVADGGTVVLGPGTYELDQLVTITRSVHLVGAGQSTTRIACTVKGKGILVEGASSFAASGITFAHEGAVPGGAVSVTSGEVDIRACRFTGASSNRGGYPSVALWLHENVIGVVENCVADDSDIGIGVSGTASPVIDQCACTSNSQLGIDVYGSARPALRHDRCLHNGGAGIELENSAHPTVESCVCSSARLGILATDKSAGVVKDCTCDVNTISGVQLAGHAHFLVSNTNCGRNHGAGILVSNWAVATLSGNTCLGNTYVGIAFADHARGTARANDCRGNAYGIAIKSPATAKLVGNLLSSNSMQPVLHL